MIIKERICSNIAHAHMYYTVVFTRKMDLTSAFNSRKGNHSGGLRGRVVRVFDFKPFASHLCEFETSFGAIIFHVMKLSS